MAIGSCRECGKEASTEAKACPHCGASKPVKKKISPLTVVIVLFLVLFVVFKILPGSSNNVAPSATNTSEKTSAAADRSASVEDSVPELKVEYASPTMKSLVEAPPSDSPKNSSRWSYQTFQDEMSAKQVHTAEVTADEPLSFGFPYNGGSYATLLLRKHPRKGTDVMLMVSKGHFLCRSYDGCSVSVKFDDGPATRYHANEPSDHSTEVLFLSSEGKLISAIKKSKVTRIEAGFYQEGSRVMTFQTAGLDWGK